MGQAAYIKAPGKAFRPDFRRCQPLCADAHIPKALPGQAAHRHVLMRLQKHQQRLEVGIRSVDHAPEHLSAAQRIDHFATPRGDSLRLRLCIDRKPVFEAPGIGVADADILLLDAEMNIDTTIALGRVLLRDGRMQVFCNFEDC